MVFTRISRSALVRGSVTVFIGSMTVNGGNFLYNVLMVRMLGPEQYADMGALLSVLILLGAPLSILQLVIVKQTSVYWGKRELGKILSLQMFLAPKLYIISTLVVLLLLAGSRLLGTFLHIDSMPVLVIFALFFVLSGPSAMNRAILHGTLSFTYMAVNNAAEALIKIIVSVVLVLLNFQLAGALLGSMAGGIVSYALSVVQLKQLLKLHKAEEMKRTPFKDLQKFVPLFIASLSLTIFFTADIILVRHFFSASVAGEYVALATIGRISFYAIGPVLTVMFPLISSKASSGQSYILSLLATLLMTLAVAVGVISAYFLFPKLIVGILFGQRYWGITGYLGIFAVYMSIYSLNSVLTHFFLSVSYYRPILLLFAITILQSIGITVFHSGIRDVIAVNIIVSMLYFFVCLWYIWQREKKEISLLLHSA